MLAAVAAAAALSAVTVSSDQQRAASTGKQIGSQPRAAAGSVVVRDPDTGQFRDATPEELLALQGQSIQAAQAPEPIVSATGLAGLNLTDDQMTFTVATRNADGSVSIAHADGKTQADAKVRAAGRGLVAGKEQPLER